MVEVACAPWRSGLDPCRRDRVQLYRHDRRRPHERPPCVATCPRRARSSQRGTTRASAASRAPRGQSATNTGASASPLRLQRPASCHSRGEAQCETGRRYGVECRQRCVRRNACVAFQNPLDRTQRPSLIRYGKHRFARTRLFPVQIQPPALDGEPVQLPLAHLGACFLLARHSAALEHIHPPSK